LTIIQATGLRWVSKTGIQVSSQLHDLTVW
jgi:hypothetical protein